MSELQGIARFAFRDGQLEEFKRLAAQCMEIVQAKDTGTLQFEISFNEDQSECFVLERYTDSDALIEHARNFGDLGEALIRTGWVAGELVGEPNGELKAMMASSGIRLFTPFLALETVGGATTTRGSDDDPTRLRLMTYR